MPIEPEPAPGAPIDRRDGHRYIALDAMRGAAALAVMFYHLRGIGTPDTIGAAGLSGASRVFASGYLAVDLFFVMSGFVIAHAYGHRLGPNLGARRFLLLRFVRLQPVIAIGTVLGFGLALAQRTFHLPGAPGLLAIATSLPLNLAMLPNLVFPWAIFLFNPPAWSLFYELLANAGYGALFASGARRDRTRQAFDICTVAVFLGFAGIVVTALFSGNLDRGVDLVDWPAAMARIGFSFPLGILLYRHRARWMPYVPRLPVWMLLGGCLALLAPPLLAQARMIYDIAFAVVLSPVLVMLGAVSVPGPRGLKLATWLGLVSYPLYALHAPIKHIVELATPLPGPALFAIAAALSLILAHIVAARIDPPARRLLERLLHRFASASAKRLKLPASMQQRI